MAQLAQDVVILKDGQSPPAGVTVPPRQPRWSDTVAYMADPDRFCRVNRDRYGAIFRTAVFGGTTVFVGSSQAIQMVFNGDSAYTEIGLPPTTMAMFGEYSLFQRPDLHRQRKSALSPAFTGTMLAGYIPFMHQVIASELDQWQTRTPIPLFPTIERLSFDLLAPLLLGINLHDPDTFKYLPISSQQELKQLYQTFFNGFYGLVNWPSPLTAFGRGQEARSRLLSVMRAAIQHRRTCGTTLDPTADFLSMMLAEQQANPDGVFSDALIENQCLLQLWASHYEVSGLLSSWMYQLGRHPDWLPRLRAEQAAVLPSGTAVNTLSIHDLKAMPLLEATIKETLRTLPPTSTANRRLTQSVVLDGVLYRKGWTVIAEPRIAHAQPEYFTNPDQFDPTRFLPERGEGRLYEFIPFGGGVHACLGAQLAIALTKVFAAHVLHRFNWTLPGEAPFVQFPLKRIRDDYQIQLNT